MKNAKLKMKKALRPIAHLKLFSFLIFHF